MERIPPDTTGDLDSSVREDIPEIPGLKVDEEFRLLIPAAGKVVEKVIEGVTEEDVI